MAKDNYCIYCGFKLFPEDHFCPNCGKKLDDFIDVKAKTTYSSSSGYKSTYSSSSGSKTTYARSSPNYDSFKNQIKNLKETYETKEKNVLELLEKKFPAGQISYYRFKEEVDSCRVSFFKEAEAAESMIELSDEYSDKIAAELGSKVKTLQEIVAKMSDLQSELIISISNGEDDSGEEIKNLVKEMNELIKSVKDYE